MLNYPLTRTVRLTGPTLIYIDETGTPIELALTGEQAQAVIDICNSAPDDPADETDAPYKLKPPLMTIGETIARGWVDCPEDGQRLAVASDGMVQQCSHYPYWNLFVQVH